MVNKEIFIDDEMPTKNRETPSVSEEPTKSEQLDTIQEEPTKTEEPPKKVKKPRKPMTEERRKQLAQNLKKGRLASAEKRRLLKEAKAIDAKRADDFLKNKVKQGFKEQIDNQKLQEEIDDLKKKLNFLTDDFKASKSREEKKVIKEEIKEIKEEIKEVKKTPIPVVKPPRVKTPPPAEQEQIQQRQKERHYSTLRGYYYV